MSDNKLKEGDSPSSRPAGQSYHHGNLRAALLTAAEEELTEKGLEGFSLRGVAKRAGVSHAAPAHHFQDVTGLLTALAAEGFRRFLDLQMSYQAVAPSDGVSRLKASGTAYVDFASEYPAMFRLMFSSKRPDFTGPELAAAGGAAFNHLVADVGLLRGVDPAEDETIMADVTAFWAMAHGLADLLMAGRLKWLDDQPDEIRRQWIGRFIARAGGDP